MWRSGVGAASSARSAAEQPDGHRLDRLKSIDAWGAVAVRTSIELNGRAQQQRVTVSPPSAAEAWRLLYWLLEQDCPAHVILSDDADRPSLRPPTAIIVPAIPVSTVDRADNLAEAVISSASGRLTRSVRFIAQEIPELVLNALTHRGQVPTQPVVCAFYDRGEDEVQLVVSDLGSRYDGDSEAAEKLLAAVQAQPDGGLTTAVESAAARGIDATLTLAAGTGRLYWRRGNWLAAPSSAVSGFTAALARCPLATNTKASKPSGRTL